jgi:hypothetical protein
MTTLDTSASAMQTIPREARPRRIIGMPKRGYSREFRPHGQTGKRYLLDSIPAGLWATVREKCKREGVSIRAQILKLLTEWVQK